MRNEFTAVIEREDDRYIAYCPEIPGTNGQGRTIEECRASLADAIALILEDSGVVARPYTFKQLIAGVTKENIHAEIKTGPPVGKEAL